MFLSNKLGLKCSGTSVAQVWSWLAPLAAELRLQEPRLFMAESGRADDSAPAAPSWMASPCSCKRANFPGTPDLGGIQLPFIPKPVEDSRAPERHLFRC
ncbi:hypothetical protein CEXT_25791 [Caerostris extrusa]|uniref:Uncharacterized protein n=1 Tax=Caerostris extrusa TaxID=172846 RepID=A0AAV4PKG7_CAEEX|nr:hypothetical protein CEXT_25791 [Caerostris extrusa]